MVINLVKIIFNQYQMSAFFLPTNLISPLLSVLCIFFLASVEHLIADIDFQWSSLAGAEYFLSSTLRNLTCISARYFALSLQFQDQSYLKMRSIFWWEDLEWMPRQTVPDCIQNKHLLPIYYNSNSFDTHVLYSNTFFKSRVDVQTVKQGTKCLNVSEKQLLHHIKKNSL